MYKQIDSNKRRTAFLITLFIIFVMVLGWLYGQFTETGYDGLVIAGAISLFMALTSYYAGDKIALTTAGAEPIAEADAPNVYHLVENLCITAGLPMPKIYIINDPDINAFATGRDIKNASLAITSGAINKLSSTELEGVIAHELSHIKNYDIRLMMVVLVLVGIIALLSDWLLRGFFWRRRSSEKNEGGIIFLIIGIILAVLSPLIAQLIQLAVSRKREFLADADGALLTRYPEGLASALEKIKTENIAPLKHANNATAHLYIASPFGNTKTFLNNLFSTHPPIEERIARLRAMTQ